MLLKSWQTLQISPVKVGANTAVRGKTWSQFDIKQCDQLRLDEVGEGLNLKS